jgi:hypothetical protein
MANSARAPRIILSLAMYLQINRSELFLGESQDWPDAADSLKIFIWI